MRLQKITKRWAKKHDACKETVERFFKAFPDGLDLGDAEQVKKAWRLMTVYDIAWLLAQIRIGPLCSSGGCDFHCCCYDAPFTKGQLRPYAKKAGLPI